MSCIHERTCMYVRSMFYVHVLCTFVPKPMYYAVRVIVSVLKSLAQAYMHAPSVALLNSEERGPRDTLQQLMRQNYSAGPGQPQQ